MSTAEGFGESEEQTEQQPEADSESSMTVFKVTCGDVAGTLHKKRFGSGNVYHKCRPHDGGKAR